MRLNFDIKLPDIPESFEASNPLLTHQGMPYLLVPIHDVPLAELARIGDQWKEALLQRAKDLKSQKGTL